MKTRAELEKEPRTMQFEIERMCPQILATRADVRESWQSAKLPIRIWVKLPGIEPPSNSRVECDTSKIYMVESGPVEAQDEGFAPAVCEHMGRLIE